MPAYPGGVTWEAAQCLPVIGRPLPEFQSGEDEAVALVSVPVISRSVGQVENATAVDTA